VRTARTSPCSKKPSIATETFQFDELGSFSSASLIDFAAKLYLHSHSMETKHAQNLKVHGSVNII
jgi:hypothetical protein